MIVTLKKELVWGTLLAALLAVHTARAAEPTATESSASAPAAAAADPRHAPKRTLYVNALGNDQNDGAARTPWRSLQRAASGARPGDLILVAKGEYAGFVMGWEAPQGGTAQDPIVFQAAAGATISARNGKSADGINLEGADFVIVDGFTIDNAKGSITRAGIRSVKNDGVVIRNNMIDNCGTWGIFASFSRHLVIENNTAAHAKNQHGIYFSNSADEPVIRGNRVFGNHLCGIHINGDGSQGGDGIVSRALIENNIIYDNGAAGGSAINCDGMQDSRIQNNLLYGNHANGISLYKVDGSASSTGNVVVNNTIVMAGDSRWAVNIKNQSTGNTVYNNILCNQNAARGAINITEDSRAGFACDYNAVDGRFSPDDDRVISLSAWQGQVGQDTHSFSTTVEKLFVNFKAQDFHLADASPAIRAGTSLEDPRQAPRKDMENAARPEQEGWDIGAYEAPRPLKVTAIPNTPASMGLVPLGAVLLVVGGAMGLGLLRGRGMSRWLLRYVLQTGRRGAGPAGKPIHVLLCIADHYEPHNGEVTDPQADERVARWVERYPEVLGKFHDSDGRPPRHTFFYPVEQYDPEHVEAIAGLCRQGFGEVEIHLHHSRDTGENLERTLVHAKRVLAERHGLLARRRDNGEVVYGFVHGDWALSNPQANGEGCGVDNELAILQQTGCYADFTFPSAPSKTQNRMINSIYYADTRRTGARAHERGVEAGRVHAAPKDGLLLIQGPLVLNWRRRKAGVLPRIENACLQGNQIPSMERLDQWLRARVQVPSRPDWYFVKLHTHGAPESNQAVLLGPPMAKFHWELAQRAARDRNFHYHYVTAREMYNLVKAAQAGWTGSVNEARDFELVPQPLFERAGT